MDKRDIEFPAGEELPLPPEEFPAPSEEAEFHPPGAEGEYRPPSEEAEFSPPDPAQEYPLPGSSGTESAAPRRKRRLWRRLLYSAAALGMAWLMLPGIGPAAPAAAIPVAVVTARPEQTSVPAGPGESAAAEPTSAPTPVPTEAPTPEPTPGEPVYRVVFFSFSAEHHGLVELENQERVTAASVEIREANLDTVEWSHELTAEEIASGRYEIPSFDDSETYFKYMEQYRADDSYPELELRFSLTEEGPDGPETVELTREPSYEQGWAALFWPEGFQPRWEDEEFYPDSFALRSYEAYGAPPDIRMGGYEDAAESGAICVTLTLDGARVSGEDSRVVTREEAPFADYGFGEKYFYTTLVIPRPADAPPSGTAEFHVFQRLAGYDLVWESVETLEYGP